MAKMKSSDGMMVMAIFIGAIIAVTFMSPIGDAVFNTRNLVTQTNETRTTAAVNATITLSGRANTTPVTVVNATSGVDWTANFTVTTTDSAGNLVVFLQTTQAASDAGQAAQSANLTYTYEPQGYLRDSGARGITALIVIMASLAIVIFVIVVIWGSSLKDLLKVTG